MIVFTFRKLAASIAMFVCQRGTTLFNPFFHECFVLCRYDPRPSRCQYYPLKMFTFDDALKHSLFAHPEMVSSQFAHQFLNVLRLPIFIPRLGPSIWEFSPTKSSNRFKALPLTQKCRILSNLSIRFFIRLLQRRSNCPLLSQHQPVVSWNWENIGILFEIGKQPICTYVMQIPMYILYIHVF